MSRVTFGIAAALAWSVVAPVWAASGAQHQPPAASTDSGVPAAEPLGSAGAWSAYASRDKTGRVCYLAGHPQKSEAAGATRNQPMAMVTHRPAENIANVVSFVEGYSLKNGSTATLEVGGRKFDLFTNGDSAWAATSDLDRTIVATLAKNSSATVKGEPEKGHPTTDTYALSGFAKALALIDKACGVSRAGVPPAPKPLTKSHKRRSTHR